MLLTSRRMNQGRGSLELLESEKQMCNLISKYTPQYVRSRALQTPMDALAVLVSSSSGMVGVGINSQCPAGARPQHDHHSGCHGVVVSPINKAALHCLIRMHL